MTTFTRTELATRVLKDLGLIGAEETPSASDLDWSGETVDSVVAMLAAIGLPIWDGSEMAVPQAYLVPLSNRIGLNVGPSFGLMSLAQAQAAIPEAERNLTIMANPRGGRPLSLVTNEARPRRGGSFNYTTGQ
jgi:hypothetical protein